MQIQRVPKEMVVLPIQQLLRKEKVKKETNPIVISVEQHGWMLRKTAVVSATAPLAKTKNALVVNFVG